VLASLDEDLPAFWSHGNPVDLVATVTEGAVERVVEKMIACANVDALIVSGVASVMSLMEGLLREARRLDAKGALRLDPDQLLDPRSFQLRRQAFVNTIVDLMNRYQKPILCVSAVPQLQTVFKPDDESVGPVRVVVISSPVRAVKVMAAMVGFAQARSAVDRRGTGPGAWRGQ
jgi:hypothetical protein